MSTQKTYTKITMLGHFLKGCMRFFVFTILCSLLVTVFEMLIPQVIRQTVDAVIGTEEMNAPGFIKAWFASMGGSAFFRENLWIISVIIMVMAAVLALVIYLRGLTASVSAEKLQQNIRENLFSHIEKLPFSWHQENKTGDIIQRCTSDAERVRTFVSEQMISILRIVIMVAMSLAFMMSMNVKLTLLAMIAVPIIVTYSMVFHGKISSGFENCDENEGILSTIAQENLTGVRVVRAFGREEFERERFEKQNVYYTGLWVHLMKLMSYFWSVSDLIGGLQILLMLVLGSVFCVRGQLTAGEFIAFLSYNGMLIWPVRQLGRVISEMSKAGVSIDRIRYIMNSPIEQDRADAVSAEVTNEAVRGDIVFDHVSFGYEKDQEVLKDIDFTIEAGTTLGILGSTGSGKSTLMLLLNRLYEIPEGEGQITIGGVDIAQMKAADLRNNIGMVLQEPFLFSRTVGENIGIRDRQMALEEIRSAAKIACVDETIIDFKKGYDTIVGERGVTLSGGQKQRTAIARMLTQKAPIMVFDDSLSAVDAETDAKIRKQLQESLGQSTVILISHRVTTLMQADKVIVMDKGRIVEEGTPEELQTAGGLYQKIYDIQLSFSEDEAYSEIG
ncbi:MAG: ABC transporter ATP-binding protein [Lachnospiraceae bacterium]|nr:ABC transporter ATP-binding protein [Lachnospiraceae bacterium]